MKKIYCWTTVRVSSGSFEEMVAKDWGLKCLGYDTYGTADYCIPTREQMQPFFDEVERREVAWLNGEEDF